MPQAHVMVAPMNTALYKYLTKLGRPSDPCPLQQELPSPLETCHPEYVSAASKLRNPYMLSVSPVFGFDLSSVRQCLAELRLKPCECQNLLPPITKVNETCFLGSAGTITLTSTNNDLDGTGR